MILDTTGKIVLTGVVAVALVAFVLIINRIWDAKMTDEQRQQRDERYYDMGTRFRVYCAEKLWRYLMIAADVISLGFVGYFTWNIVMNTDMSNGFVRLLTVQMVIPPVIVAGVGFLFALFATFTKRSWAALTAGILFSVVIVMQLYVWLFMLPPALLCFASFIFIVPTKKAPDTDAE